MGLFLQLSEVLTHQGSAGRQGPRGRLGARANTELLAKAILFLLMMIGLSGCATGWTGSARPIPGQVQMVSLAGQTYPLRVIPDLRFGGHSTRIVAPTALEAMRVYAEICDGRAYAAADWPQDRLLRDPATGEWAIAADCPHLVLAGSALPAGQTAP